MSLLFPQLLAQSVQLPAKLGKSKVLPLSVSPAERISVNIC